MATALVSVDMTADMAGSSGHMADTADMAAAGTAGIMAGITAVGAMTEWVMASAVTVGLPGVMAVLRAMVSAATAGLAVTVAEDMAEGIDSIYSPRNGPDPFVTGYR